MNKNVMRTRYKKAADCQQSCIGQIFMNNYMSMIVMHTKKFYYSDQESPMDLAVIGYSSGIPFTNMV